MPAEAVIESGIRPRVFVSARTAVLSRVPLPPAGPRAGRVQILCGLRPGEEVVTAGAFLIDSESRIDAGCRYSWSIGVPPGTRRRDRDGPRVRRSSASGAPATARATRFPIPVTAR